MLFTLLLLASFFKDELTPDYLNTPAAAFLSAPAEGPRVATLGSHTGFWIASVLYSLLFVLLPYFIIRLYSANRNLARLVLAVHAGVCILIYLMVFAGSTTLDRAIIPKLNRYFHSPIMTLFFIAAFTLSRKRHAEE